MNDTARALLVAAVLSGSGLGWFVWHLARIDPSQPERLIGELRFTQWMAVVLGVTAGAWVGLAAGAQTDYLSGLDITLAAAYAVFAAWVMQRDTRVGLVALSVALVAHALIDVAHRPGGLSPDLAPRWFTVGCAAYNVYLAALCFWVQRR